MGLPNTKSQHHIRAYRGNEGDKRVQVATEKTRAFWADAAQNVARDLETAENDTGAVPLVPLAAAHILLGQKNQFEASGAIQKLLDEIQMPGKHYFVDAFEQIGLQRAEVKRAVRQMTEIQEQREANPWRTLLL